MYMKGWNIGHGNGGGGGGIGGRGRDSPEVPTLALSKGDFGEDRDNA